LRVDEFDFDLPRELIAQEPAPRGQSRLLVIDRPSGELRHASIRDLPSFLRRGDVLVTNDTRVFPARLLGRRVPSGGSVECLLLFAASNLPASQFRSPTAETWQALVHPGQKLKPGARIVFEGAGATIHGEILERHFYGRRTIRLTVERGTVADAIDAIGHIPLPPYIHRADTAADRERYQTVFARHRGSVAAPTAGLHFDDALLSAIDGTGAERISVTLHVGYGTFKPVRSETVEDHVVDPEPYEISESAARAINAARAAARRVIAVGTTTTRALEDAARRGGGTIRAGRADADLFIHPGHEFRVIGGLLTNFHLPKSSLLMLVAAFAGRDRILASYREAVERRYRFYSYGDATLIA
jgi:S-adenosylmethionine:tRNA ribosyltransferase-isomerase